VYRGVETHAALRNARGIGPLAHFENWKEIYHV
jgi:hypothetical protein